MNAFYKVNPGGPAYTILFAHIEQTMAANDAGREWAKKHTLPAIGIRGTTVWFTGSHVPDKALWKHSGKRGGGYTPRLNVAEGKALARELEDLPQAPSGMNLIMALSKEAEELDIMRINQTGFPGLMYDTKNGLRAHIDPYWLPTDRTGVVEITASEYEAKAA